MKDIKYYDLLDPYSNKNWNDLSIKDLIAESEYSWFSNNLDKYKRLSDISSKSGKEIMNILLKSIWVETDFNTLKWLWTVSFEVRKIIKDNKPELIDIIDSPNFLIAYTYIIAWFNTLISSYNWKEWINSHQALSSTIIKILENTNIKVSSFLCAHREHEDINKYWLVNNINLLEFQRVLNLVDWIFKNLWKDYSIDFYNTEWDVKGMNTVFPSLFLKYLERWELWMMSDQLNNHIKQLIEYKKDNVNIKSVSTHFDETKRFLDNKYWNEWGKISKRELENLAEEDIVSEKAYYMTYKELERFDSAFKEFYNKYSKKDIDKMISLNLENIKNENKKQIVVEAIELFFQKSSELTWKALYETAFYYLWWKKKIEFDLVLIGIMIYFRQNLSLYDIIIEKIP